MEILNNIWTSLTTPNTGLMEFIFNKWGIPFVFIESLVTMLLFTTILNIPTTKKQKFIYVIGASIIGAIINSIFPKDYSSLLIIVSLIVLVKFIFKTTIVKSIVAIVIIQSCAMALLDILLYRLSLMIFKFDYDVIVSIPLYRIAITSIIYFIIFILYLVCKKFNLNISMLDNMNKKDKRLLILNCVFALLVVGCQIYLVIEFYNILPVYISFLSFISLISYLFISMYSLSETTKLQLTTQDLEQTKQYNKTLSILHDNIRCFKHDFNNIVTTIGGYVQTDDMDGLKQYYSDLIEDCQKVNNLNTLSPDVINNPAIYTLLATKYYIADERGIKINLEIFLDLNLLNMKIYEFTRVLGILLDNAIEATNECEEKIINLIIRKEENPKRQLVILENTYLNKDVDIEKIFEKGHSSKASHTGLGLWEVRQILKKNNNLNLYTTKNDKFFKQQLEIY